MKGCSPLSCTNRHSTHSTATASRWGWRLRVVVEDLWYCAILQCFISFTVSLVPSNSSPVLSYICPQSSARSSMIYMQALSCYTWCIIVRLRLCQYILLQLIIMLKATAIFAKRMELGRLPLHLGHVTVKTVQFQYLTCRKTSRNCEPCYLRWKLLVVMVTMATNILVVPTKCG